MPQFTTCRRALAALALSVTLAAVAAHAAGAQPLPSARVIRSHPNGSYTVIIGTDTMLAITKDAVRHALHVENELRGARQELVAKDTLLAQYARTVKAFDTLRVHNRNYITELETQLAGYRRLADGYRRLSQRGSWLSLQGGIGATGDTKPALLGGVGFRQFRAWAFLQEQNSGGFVGVNVPLF